MSEIIVNVDPEEVPNVIIKVDENSAQTAIDAAAAAQLALEEINNTDFGYKLDKDGYTGSAKTLDERIELLESLPISSTIVSETGFSLSDQSLTINANWNWILQNQNYTNPLDIVISIPLSAAGKKRIEYVVPNNANEFDRVSGPETTGIATAPTLSNKGMYVTFYTVTDSLIEEAASPNVGNIPSLQEVTNVNARTTNPISIRNKNGLNGISIHGFAVSMWKWVNGVSIYSNIRIDNITETYEIQLPNKLGGAEQTLAMVSDLEPYEKILQVDSKDAAKLIEAKTYADGLITQLINGAPADGNTLKELNDKILAVQAVIGGSTADGDAIVNTVSELLAVFATFPEAVDLVTLLAGKVNTTDVYNALDCIVAGKVLDARQGKVLNDLISTLTTSLGNKVDKVAGERLINAGEITKLAGLGSITTTVKPILSTALATQNVAGFVTYINALNPVLVVGASEIVKYNLTDTGRIFQLNLRGRSFGVGQTAIVAADVLELTDFLNKEIRLSNYLNTRNDGANPTNKLLGTDASGNLKLYSMALMPAPFLLVLIPDSTLPSTTTNFVLKGAFFTPTMTVSIVGQTINYITFVSDNEVKVNVTTGSTEGRFTVTLNNGISATFNNALLIVLGVVYIPEATDWLNIIEPINFEKGSVLTEVFKSVGKARLNKTINISKNFRISFKLTKSPLNGVVGFTAPTHDMFFIKDIVTDEVIWRVLNYQAQNIEIYDKNGVLYTRFSQTTNIYNAINTFEYVNGLWYLKGGNNNANVTVNTYANNLVNNCYLEFSVATFDFTDIKYIELAN